MKIKNLISVLLGLGIIFIGGEKLALQGKATSIKPTVSTSTSKAFNYGVLNPEVLDPTNSDLQESETDESSLLGESSLTSVTDESLGNLEGNSTSLDSEAIGDQDSIEGNSEDSGGVSDLSEASLSVQSSDEQSLASSDGDSSEASDSIGDSSNDSSLAESSMEVPADTGDRSPIGIAAVMLGISGIAGIALTIRKKK